MCNGPQETIQHILLSCPFTRIIWRNVRWPLDTSTFGSIPITVWIKAVLRPHAELAIPKVDVHNFQVTATVAMYQIWLARKIPSHRTSITCPIALLSQMWQGYTLLNVLSKHQIYPVENRRAVIYIGKCHLIILLFRSKFIYEFLLAVSCVQSPISDYGVAFCVEVVNDEDAIAVTLGYPHSTWQKQISIWITETDTNFWLSRRTGDRKWKELCVVATSCLLCYLALSICWPWPFGILVQCSQWGFSSFVLTGPWIPCSP